MIMRKCQLLSVALLACVFAMPNSSWALGLDEIEVTSALNERFAGTIELLDAQGLQASEIVVSMASREDFERVGVERFFYLTNLKFNVELDGSVPTVKVSSSQPISEPYLNFIVEVLWPRGRLLKEYTVLLDPPTFSEVAAPAVTAPAQSAPQVAAQPSRTQVQPRPATQVNIPSRSQPAPRPLAGADELMTTRDDTLWKIAERTRASEAVSINQQMLAIQRKNPNAFMRNNINLLKAGYVLDLPSESEALSLSEQVASNDVAAQTQDWRSGTDRQQVASDSGATQLIDDGAGEPLRSRVDATDNNVEQTASNASNEGQVRIVASTGELASGTASGDDPSVNQLIEQNETLNRQVDELNYQLDREKEIATNEVAVKDRLIEVKDQALADAQEQLQTLREELARSQQNQNQSPKPAEQDTPFWMSPMVLFGVIVALVLILAFALVALRRSRQAESAMADYVGEDTYASDSSLLVEPGEDAAGYDDADDETYAADEPVEPFIGEVDSDESAELSDADQEIADLYEDEDVPTDAGEEDQGETQTGDVIGEAEIYIAYGRYGQAANLLAGVVEKEPERWDVRLKLLEVYVESQDAASFADHAQYIVDNCEDEEVLHACRELESQLDTTGVDIGSGSPMAEELETSEAPAADDVEDGFELDLDDLETASDASDELVSAEDDELTLDESLEDVASLDTAEDDKAEEDLGLDFELEFDDATEEGAPAEDAATGSGDELGGDLGIDFDPDKDTEDAPASDSDISAADGELDLDDMLADLPGEDTPASVDESGSAEGDEFEFGGSEEGDVNATKLDLAEAYIDMGDADGAQDILREVIEEGSPEQQQKANELLSKIGD